MTYAKSLDHVRSYTNPLSNSGDDLNKHWLATYNMILFLHILNIESADSTYLNFNYASFLDRMGVYDGR